MDENLKQILLTCDKESCSEDIESAVIDFMINGNDESRLAAKAILKLTPCEQFNCLYYCHNQMLKKDFKALLIDLINEHN